MKKIIIIVAVLFVFAGAYWLVSPFFINTEVREGAEEISKKGEMPADQKPAEMNVISQGSFVGADNFHKAEGMAKLIAVGDKYFVRFENDFKVTNGPDLFVYFGRDGAYVKESRIAALKGNIGSQNYEVPPEIDPSGYNEIWVWCRAFSVPFGHVVLK